MTALEAEDSQWPASRIVHLKGGVRAINIDGPEVHISPNALHGKIFLFHTHSFKALFSDLQRLGFLVVGADFYTHISELKGELPPKWRVFNQTANTVWPSEETARIWNGIAYAAFKQKEGHVWDLASRIGHQLRVCSWRIRQLSESYHQQLIARASKSTVALGLKFSDKFTWNIYLAVQSYLVDACILRDYLSEFASIFVFGNQYDIDVAHVSTIGGLIKKVLKKEEISDPFSNELRIATGKNGWLKILGEYRDLVIHSAPLEHAEMRLFAIIDAVQINAEGAIPLIKIPLPNNPGGISSSRASREHFSDFQLQSEKFIKSVSEGNPTIDALTYIVQTQGKLASLATRLSIESPIPYQDIVLTEKDLR